MFRQIAAGLCTLAKPDRVPVRPIHLQIEPTTHCNLRCLSCPIDSVVTAPQHIDFTLYRQLIDELRPQQVLLNGIGEPFTNPELLRLVAYAKQSGAAINVTTNGTLIGDHLDAILDSGLDILSISLDAATPETYRAVRGKDHFDRVVGNIARLAEAKRRRRSRFPYLRTHFVLQARNLHEAADFAALSAKSGIQGIYYQPMTLAGGIAERRDALVGDLTFEKFRDRLLQARERSKACGISTNVGFILRRIRAFWSQYTGTSKDTSRCIFPWFSAYVTVDGRVQPCCSFATVGREGTLGTVSAGTAFAGIWNSRPYADFRKNMRNGVRTFSVCRECNPRSLADLIDISAISPGFLKPLR